MLRILRFIFTGDWHLHKWEDAGQRQAVYDGDDKRPFDGWIAHEGNANA